MKASNVTKALKELLSVRFHPNRDLAAIAVMWCLVTGSLLVATNVFTPARGGLYFIAYGIVGALGFGVALPTWWMVVYRKRGIRDLGITTRLLGISLVLQAVLAVNQISGTLARQTLPATQQLLALAALSIGVGLFEAIFWRGFVQSRLEEMFGFIPALLLGSTLYALYHIGYGMPWSEIGFLFLIGLMYGVIFRFTRNVFILWPVLMPLGTLTTLVKDGMTLPPIAALGFGEVLAGMAVVLYIAHRYEKKRGNKPAEETLARKAELAY